MINGITEINFGSKGTLSSATVTENEMGDKTISADVKVLGSDVDFSGCELEYKGERYVLTVNDPRGTKSAESINAIMHLDFEHEAIHELKRYYFFDAATVGSDIVVDQYTKPIGLSLSDFVTNFNRVLSYYFSGSIIMRIAEDYTPSSEVQLIELDYTYIWEVLQKGHEQYKVRWELFKEDEVYVIEVGKAETSVSDHVFQYGYDGGLTKIERQLQDTNIRNKIFGRGGDKNLPKYYFKQSTDDVWESDPDYCQELANINMSQLRGKTFRDYIQGWNYGKDRPNKREYPDEPTEEWLRGYDDATSEDGKFEPIEYVKDDDSIVKYGELWGNAEDLDDIYPSIQSAETEELGRLDEIIYFENNTPDSVDEVAAEETKLEVMNAVSDWRYFDNPQTQQTTDCEFKITSAVFSVPEGTTGSILISTRLNHYYSSLGGIRFAPDTTYYEYNGKPYGFAWEPTENKETYYYKYLVSRGYVEVKGEDEYILHSTDGRTWDSPINIPSGEWYMEYKCVYAITTPRRAIPGHGDSFALRLEAYDIAITTTAQRSLLRTFDIWIKNIWGSEKSDSESAEAYVSRVWTKILGDAAGKEAKVAFSSGDMARSEDYEFLIPAPITDFIHYDTSKSLNGVSSEWRLTLEKSDVEYSTDGKFIPREGIAPKPRQGVSTSEGDKFFFIGIDVPFSYVELAEAAIDAKKLDILASSKDIEPQWNIEFDKVRINTLEDSETASLASLLGVGRKITIADPRFIGEGTKSLVIESMTTTWDDGTVNSPTITVTLAQEVRTVTSSIRRLESKIDRVASESVNTEEVETISSNTVKTKALMSSGTPEASSAVPTVFSSSLESNNFQSGFKGGQGWSLSRNSDGNSILEIDKLTVRQSLNVKEVVSNEVKHEGGISIRSFASLKIQTVETRTDCYHCIFDTNSGAIKNNFVVNDIAYCQIYDYNYDESRTYKYRVKAVGDNYVDLDTNSYSGNATPRVGDTIIQYGNTSNTSRQYVVVTDLQGGANERMLFGLNSVNATGTEYYYVGSYTDEEGKMYRRWFLGEKGQNVSNYIEYAWNPTTESYVLAIGGDVYIGNSQVRLDTLNYLAASLGDDNNSGLVLANQMAVYHGNQIMGGINGQYDATLTSGGIAAWFGGSKTDTGAGKAGVVFRFDGSGYVAKDNISWDKDGNVIINGSVKVGVGDTTIGNIKELAEYALPKANVTSKGAHNLPVYFNSNGTAQSVDAIDVPGLVIGRKGVSAAGIPDLTLSGAGRGRGTVTKIEVNGVEHEPDVDGKVELPDYPADLTEEVEALQDAVSEIESLIPEAASDSNPLVDTASMNDAIEAVEARGLSYNAQGDAFPTKASLTNATTFYYGGSAVTPTNNDIVYVLADEGHDGGTTKYALQNGVWAFRILVNESPMTQEQLDALNSGITSAKVGGYDNPTFTEASTLTNITSGESASTLWGKVKKAISSHITHLADDVRHITSAERTAWNAKQNTISDLDDIREGAGLGSTSVQPEDISDMETQTHASSTYATKTEIQSKAGNDQIASNITASNTGHADTFAVEGVTLNASTLSHCRYVITFTQTPSQTDVYGRVNLTLGGFTLPIVYEGGYASPDNKWQAGDTMDVWYQSGAWHLQRANYPHLSYEVWETIEKISNPYNIN